MLPHKYNFMSVNALFCGMLAQETIINLNKDVFINKIGGNLLYTAYSYNIWRKGAGLVSRVGENFSEEWIQKIENNHFNTLGIKRLPLDLDMRAFYVQISEDKYSTDNPQRYFAELQRPFPKSLLGYSDKAVKLDNRKSGNSLSLRPEDIPSELANCQFVYLCPQDFFTHSLIPPLFRTNIASSVFINPPDSYMHSSFYFDIAPLLRGSTAVITTQKRAERLFMGRIKGIWDMAEAIANFGVELVVIDAGKDGQYLIDNSSKKKYHLPAYPVHAIDTVSANDAFGGGFIAGYSLHYDPKMALMMGNISASFKVEGSTPDYLLHTMPELAKARLENIKDKIVEC